MWYFGCIFLLIILVTIITIIGRPLCETLPFRFRSSAKFLLSPVIGLSILMLTATACEWLFRATPYLCIPVTLLLTAVAFCFDRNKSSLLKHLSVLWGYTTLSSGTLLFNLLRYDCFNPFNDTFTYLVHSQWLQQHPYREPALLSGLLPALTQVDLYQSQGLRMGASFVFAWIQGLFGITWSYLVYPVSVNLPLIVGSLVIGYCAGLNSRGRYKPLLVALFSTVSFNGFAFGTLFGFLPQTYGIAFSMGALVLLGVENTRLREMKTWREAFLHAIPCALLFSSLVFSYSEMAPFAVFAFLLASSAYYLFERDCLHGMIMFSSALLVEVALLLNVEMIRACRAILLQSKVVVGGPVDWSIIDFAAHALGFRAGIGDHSSWLFGSPVISLLVPALLLAALFLNRKKLISKRFLPLLPCIVFIAVSGVFFIYYRYGMPSPWPIGKGQSWNQFKIANWVSAIAMIPVGLAVLQATKKAYYSRVLVLLLLFSTLVGVYRNYSLADNRTRAFRDEVGSQTPYTELISLSNYTKKFFRPDQKIYLELKNNHHKLRQMVTYFLWDFELTSDWSDDAYLCGVPTAPLSNSTSLIKFSNQNDLRSLTPTFGNLAFTETPNCIARLKTVEGGYDLETNDKGSWWYWTPNALNFQYEFEGAQKPESLSIQFQYLCKSSRSIKVVIQSPDSSKEFIIQSRGGWQSYETEVRSSSNKLAISFTSPDPAERLSETDERMAKFLVKDLQVIAY